MIMCCERAVMHPAPDVAERGRSIRHATDCTREKIAATPPSVVAPTEKLVCSRMKLIRVPSKPTCDRESRSRFASGTSLGNSRRRECCTDVAIRSRAGMNESRVASMLSRGGVISCRVRDVTSGSLPEFYGRRVRRRELTIAGRDDAIASRRVAIFSGKPLASSGSRETNRGACPERSEGT
jgi:hypothetical protein